MQITGLMFICPTHPSRILTMLPKSSRLSVTLSSRHLSRSARNPLLGRIRGFSTANMPKKEFLCLLPDKPNVLEQRKIAGPYVLGRSFPTFGHEHPHHVSNSAKGCTTSKSSPR